MSHLATIEGLEYLNTSETTDMGCMFYRCSSLENIDLSSINTQNVKDNGMIGMFADCNSLRILDLSNFDTKNVKSMTAMFGGCHKLQKIYCSELWDKTNVTESEMMFEGCWNLVGGKGTAYDENHTDAEYARIDGGEDSPGYFTSIVDTTEISKAK